MADPLLSLPFFVFGKVKELFECTSLHKYY